MFNLRSFVFLFATLLLPVGAWAKSAAYNQGAQPFCAMTPLSLCGETLSVPSATLGETLTVRLPEKFVNRDVMVQCVPHHDSTYYKIIQNVDTSFCELKRCKFSKIPLCGSEVGLIGEVAVGEQRRLTVPSSLMVPSKAARSSWFEVQCRLDDGEAKPVVVNTAGMSCNDFPCQAASLDLCGEKIALQSEAMLGDVLHVMTEGNHPVTVQCIASGGNRPSYTVTDSSSVPACK